MSQQQQTVLRVQSGKADPLFVPIVSTLNYTPSGITNTMTVVGTGTTENPYTGITTGITDIYFTQVGGPGLVQYSFSGTSAMFLYIYPGGNVAAENVKATGSATTINGQITVDQGDVLRIVMAPSGKLLNLSMTPNLTEQYIYEILDLYNDIPIKITKSFAELQDISKRNSDYSVGLSIPGSKKNNRFFENFFNVDTETLYFDATKRANAQVLISDEVYFNGYLRLNSVSVLNSKVEYDVTIYSTVADIFGKIGNSLMNELNYYDDQYNFNHTFDSYTITNGWQNQPYSFDDVPLYFYPVIHNGYNYSGDTVLVTGSTTGNTTLYTSTKVGSWANNAAAYAAGVQRFRINSPQDGVIDNQLKPALNVNGLIGLMFKDNGYSIKSNFFNSPWFKLLYTYGYFSSEATKFTTQLGTISILPSAGVNLLLVNTGIGQIYIYVVQAGTGIPCLCTQPLTIRIQYYNTIGQTYQQSYTIQPFTASIIATYSFFLGYRFQTVVSSTVPISNKPLAYQPSAIGTTITVTDGTFIDFSNVINNQIKQIDFLASIAKKFDLVFIPDPDNPNQIIIEPFDYYIGSGNIYDWTDKLSWDKGFKVQPALNFIESELILTDKEDNDEGNKRFKEVNNRVYGENKVFNPTDFKSQSKKIETTFSPQLIRQWDTLPNSGNIGLPLGINYAGSTNESPTGDSTKNVYTYTGTKRQNPKLFYYVGNFNPFTDTYHEVFNYSGTTLTNKFYVQSSDQTIQQEANQAPIISHTMPLGNPDSNKIVNDSACILFNSETSFDVDGVNTFDAFTENDLYRLFYQNRISNLYNKDTRFLSGYFDLKLSDIKNLQPNDLIKINEQLFTVNKIQGYNLINPELTQVELVQFNNTLEEYPVRYFQYYYCDDPTTVFRFKTDMTNESISGTSYGWSIRYDYFVGTLNGTATGYTTTVKDLQSSGFKYVGFYIYEVDETTYNASGIDRQYDTLWSYTVDFSGDLNNINYPFIVQAYTYSPPKEVFNLFRDCADWAGYVSAYSIPTGSSTYHGVVVTPTPTATLPPTPTPTPTPAVIGSLILSFTDEIPELNSNQVSITKNGSLVETIYDDINDLYITSLQENDVVTICVTGNSYLEYLTIDRNSYTNDGITTTSIADLNSSGNTLCYTFTATTEDCEYNFEYIVDAKVLLCFNSGTGFSGFTSDFTNVTDIDLLSDGKLLISGEFLTYDGIAASRIIKLNTHGTVDTSFNYGSGFTPDTTNEVIELPDGTLIIGGQFEQYNGTAALRIIGLNPDGSVNTGFVYGTGFNSDPRGLVKQSDNKIIVAGAFWEYNGITSSKIARLNTDGSYDSTFVVGTGFTLSNQFDSAAIYVEGIGLQSDGKVVVGGRFDKYKGIATPRIARLNTDGSLDTSFNGVTSGFTSGAINAITIQPDGKILIGGSFSSYNGTSVGNFLRLNTDGSIDTSFSGVTTGFNDFVTNITLQSNGKILVGGQFVIYNGSPVNQKIVRLNSDGSIDSTFGGIGQGANETIYEICIGPQFIYIGGRFTSYSGVNAGRIAALDFSGNIVQCQSVTPTPTPTITQTLTPTITVTPTVTPTIDVTPTITITPTITQTITPTRTLTPTPTITPTPTQTVTPTPESEAIIDITNGSLDIQISSVYVNSVVTSLVGGSLPNTTGNGTNLSTNQLGTYTIEVNYSCTVAGQKITLTDSDLFSECQNTLTGSNTMTFTNKVVQSYHNVLIEAADGTC
jgi:uncharacterized delta-60 repeat protein